MSALDRIMSSIRQVILMEAKLQTLADGVENVADLIMDHENTSGMANTVPWAAILRSQSNAISTPEPMQ